MGSSYFGEPNLGNERSGSSRKGKKSNSDKPKQPQRGLGVAQLEKLRLHSQMGCSYLPNSLHTSYPTNLNQEDMRLQAAYSSVPSSSSFSYSSSSSSSYGFHGHQNIMMGFGDVERANITYGDSQPNTTARWNPSNNMLETQHFAQQSMSTRHLLNLQVEDSQKKRKKDRCASMGSSSQNSDSSDTQELDLELRLSL
ncbi:hypothetical protein F0562_009563 [Nyssa sinensis]|uniref:Uncharacterized protein n=1 Tax=Nyssa sinensis TaxID=561372 RepID=A0A5J4ZXX5_9ASTE|nr:hypothetical protein F0562_009563 [Nyssa sinensis]